MTERLIFAIVIGGIFSGYLSAWASVRLMGVFQQLHYAGGPFLKWYFRRGNMARRRLSLLALCLALLTALLNVCFSFAGHTVANLVALAAFVLPYALYLITERRFALKVKTVSTPRFVRLGVAVFVLLTGVSLGILFGFAALAEEVGKEWLYLLRFVPVSLAPLFIPFCIAAANVLLSAYELPRGRYFLRKAKKALEESGCIKVGITGSFGKTSVKNYAQTVLSEKFRVLATPASYNTPLGIAKAVNEGGLDCDVFLAEMGARRKGDISELCALVQPTFGVITGIGGQHLETFGSIEAIRAEKGELARYARHAVLGASARGLCERAFEAERDFGVSDLQLSANGTRFVLRVGETAFPVETAVLGRHAAEDIALAAALGYLLGMTAEEISAGIGKIKPVPHRLQRMDANGVTVLDDGYNSNAEGAKNAVEILRLCGGNRYVVTPGLVELGEMEERENAALGARLVGLNVILVGETLVLALRRGYLEAGGEESRLRVVPDLKSAQRILAEELQTGDSVLFLNDLPDAY